MVNKNMIKKSLVLLLLVIGGWDDARLNTKAALNRLKNPQVYFYYLS